MFCNAANHTALLECEFWILVGQMGDKIRQLIYVYYADYKVGILCWFSVIAKLKMLVN